MLDYHNEFLQMVAPQQLMNSYKLFLLKSLFSACKEKKTRISFFDLGCYMVANSWPYIMKKHSRLRPLDKLFDVATLAIEKADVLQTDSATSIVIKLQNSLDVVLRKAIKDLTLFVPYRLLTYNMRNYLGSLKDPQKNKLIASFSKSSECFYEINNHEIEIHYDWFVYILQHAEELDLWLEQVIQDFCS